MNRLKSADFDFLATILGRDSRECEAVYRLLTDPQVLVELLDQDRVHQAILELAHPLAISPYLYFYILVRRSLLQAGIDEVRVAEYVSVTLAEQAYGVDETSSVFPQERELDYHIDVLQAMERATPYERFFLQVRCANRFLFLTGLFPKFIRCRRDRRGAPGMRYYEQVARQAYVDASRHPLATEFALAGVYQDLVDVFQETRTALNHLAEQYLFLD